MVTTFFFLISIITWNLVHVSFCNITPTVSTIKWNHQCGQIIWSKSAWLSKLCVPQVMARSASMVEHRYHQMKRMDVSWYLNIYDFMTVSLVMVNWNHQSDVTWALTKIAKFMGPTWGPPGPCRPQMGPMLAPWTLLSGKACQINGNSVAC